MVVDLLSKIWQYADDIDQWAAIREFDLRMAAWRRHRKTFMRVVK